MSEKSLTGVAGVHFVVGELSRRGWIALPTIRNTKGIDVLADSEGNSARIQVKSRTNGRIWMLTKNAEKLVGKNLVYVFVNLRYLDSPEYFVIPSEVVAEYVTRTHKLFLEAKGSDSNLRNLPNPYGEFDLERYKDKWELLFSMKPLEEDEELHE
jgi:hypothetical protein